MKNNIIADAFAKTESGKCYVASIKEQIGGRVKKINELSHDTFVMMTRETGKYRFWFSKEMKARMNADKDYTITPFNLFKASKPILRKLAVNGGDKYNDAVMKLQYTWGSEKDVKDTIEMILG